MKKNFITLSIILSTICSIYPMEIEKLSIITSDNKHLCNEYIKISHLNLSTDEKDKIKKEKKICLPINAEEWLLIKKYINATILQNNNQEIHAGIAAIWIYGDYKTDLLDKEKLQRMKEIAQIDLFKNTTFLLTIKRAEQILGLSQ